MTKVFTAFSGETFTDIKGFEGLYAVSRNGIVISLPRKIWNGKVMAQNKVRRLIGNPLNNGYLQVTLYKEHKRTQKLIHRLVAETYIENPQDLPQINHIDGNKQNNKVENLEWCDNSMNQLHAWRTGLQKPHLAGKPMRKVKLFKKGENLVFDSVASAARYLGEKNNSNLQRVLHKRPSYLTIKGYTAEYVL